MFLVCSENDQQSVNQSIDKQKIIRIAYVASVPGPRERAFRIRAARKSSFARSDFIRLVRELLTFEIKLTSLNFVDRVKEICDVYSERAAEEAKEEDGYNRQVGKYVLCVCVCGGGGGGGYVTQLTT